MQSLAQSWLVYRLTKSTLWMGTLGFSSQVPVLLLGPLAGIVADRLSRRSIVIATQVSFLIQSAILAALTLTNTISLKTLIALAMLFGIINAFDIPARQSLFVHMVGKDDLQNAIALNSMTFNAARIIGPSIAGFLVAAVGEGLCFAFNSATFVAVIVSLVIMRPVEPERERDDSALRRLRGGFLYAWNSRAVRMMLFVTALANLASTPISVLAPVFADAIFERGATGLGFLTGAMGLGAMIGTYVLARNAATANPVHVVLTSTLLGGISLAVFAASPWFHLSLAAIAAFGFSLFRQLAATNSLIQSLIDDAYRGRVMSLYSMTVVGMLPLGNLAAGTLAHAVGVRLTVAAGAVLSVAAAFIWYRESEAKTF